MKVKIVENPKKKTVTVIISPVVINFVDYLYEKYNGERYFASGVLKGAEYKEDLIPNLKKILVALNNVGKEVLPPNEKFTGKDLLTLNDDDFRLVSKNKDKDDVWDKQFKINLSSKSNKEGKRFLFKDLEMTKPIDKDDGWKYIYAVEIELGVGYNEDKMEKYIYSIFHRAIKIADRQETTFEKNDDAWDGFDFGGEEEQVEQAKDQKPANVDEEDDDLPF